VHVTIACLERVRKKEGVRKKEPPLRADTATRSLPPEAGAGNAFETADLEKLEETKDCASYDFPAQICPVWTFPVRD
jgi:hypothetical protein